MIRMIKNLIKTFSDSPDEFLINETYKLYYKEGDLIKAGITILNEGKETRGHSHDNVEEMYCFLDGQGVLQLDDEMIDVVAGDIFIIPEGVFHRVYNKGTGKLLFLVTFNKEE